MFVMMYCYECMMHTVHILVGEIGINIISTSKNTDMKASVQLLVIMSHE